MTSERAREIMNGWRNYNDYRIDQSRQVFPYGLGHLVTKEEKAFLIDKLAKSAVWKDWYQILWEIEASNYIR